VVDGIQWKTVENHGGKEGLKQEKIFKKGLAGLQVDLWLDCCV
jgi:hypothetical protein